MEIYLDNASTTKLDVNVMRVMNQSYQENYANPSSMHHAGYSVNQKMELSRKTIKDLLHVSSGELIFTSGGSEGNNLAIMGTHGWKFGRYQWICSAIEHPSVMMPYSFLKKSGEQVFQIPCQKNGMIDVAALESMVTSETAMVSLMHVNNETGIKQPLEAAIKVIRDSNPNTLIHIDGIQAVGKIRVNVSALQADFYSISGHKFNGPRGIGALFIRYPRKVMSMIMGGGQENGIRAGTENIAGIAGMEAALELKINGLNEKIKKTRSLRYQMIETLNSVLDDVHIIEATEDNQAPGILQVCIEGTKSEVMLRMLSDDGIHLSAGSACSSHKAGSHVLKAMKVPDHLIEGALRVSFDESLTLEELDYFLGCLAKNTKKMRKMMKR
ncbi:cysteine desulfurase family protein [Anoxynatronum buryatiense]|uniref:Cysteine desulfurase n=1 Tax=Anoxynatronum buryatiense TaxID=489973 RepID=A0AA45WV79_9CLOT|nr:cysteine desulfurase family protein [Anoxynatronum buryatiense]SMP49918.1 cysteine desulfurase [Anoxynatronum buryatiense]